MLKIKNLAGFRNSWQTWLAQQAEFTTFIYRGLAYEMFDYMLRETPQYTGEAVSHFTISADYPIFSAPDNGFKEEYEASAPRGLRHPFNKYTADGAGANIDAMDFALTSAHSGLRTVVPKISIGSSSFSARFPKIFITNNAPFETGEVSDIIEGKPSWLRVINMTGMTPLEAASSYVADRYATLDEGAAANLARAGQ